MSRRSKFRFWNTKLKVYGGNASIDNHGVLTYSLNRADVVARGDSYIPEQFTGLTDKNDKDIYDQDILKLVDYNGRTSYWSVFWGKHESGMRGWLAKTSTGT